MSAALGSHIQYQETVEQFSTWLVTFERSFRDTTDVFMDNVGKAAGMVKVSSVSSIFSPTGTIQLSSEACHEVVLNY